MRIREFKNIEKEEEINFSARRRRFLSPLPGARPWRFGGYPLEGSEGTKYVVAAPEVYEVLHIKAERPLNPIASTIKQTQENLNTVWNLVGIYE